MLPGHKAVIAFERYKYYKKMIIDCWPGVNYIEELINLLGLDCLGFILNDLSMTNSGLTSRACKEILKELHNRDMIPYDPYIPVEIQGVVGFDYSDKALEQIKQWAIQEGYYDE